MWSPVMFPVSLTPRFSGVIMHDRDANRFSGFSRFVKTAEAVTTPPLRKFTPLKRGVNEKGIHLRADHNLSRWAPLNV